MTDPCSLVNAGIYARLSDDSVGFNPTYAAGQASYIDAGGNPVDEISIDWTGDSLNFAYGLIPPDLIEETSPFTYPLLTISADRAQSFQAQRRVHFQRFSGVVVATIQIHLSWIESAIRDFETWPNAVVGAMLATMNAPSLSAPTVPNSWGTGVIYGYDLASTKGPILMAGQNWRRTITFTGSFEVLIP